MKKLVTLLLSLALVLSLAACGGEATPDASDDAPASSQNEESTENDNTETLLSGLSFVSFSELSLFWAP